MTISYLQLVTQVQIWIFLFALQVFLLGQMKLSTELNQLLTRILGMQLFGCKKNQILKDRLILHVIF